MDRRIDLHIHTTMSDGVLTPKEIIDSAIEVGLSAVALCDHNTVDGLHDFLDAVNNKNIKAIAGAEFSVDYNGTELHLLGLYIQENEEVNAIEKDFLETRSKCVKMGPDFWKKEPLLRRIKGLVLKLVAPLM